MKAIEFSQNTWEVLLQLAEAEWGQTFVKPPADASEKTRKLLLARKELCSLGLCEFDFDGQIKMGFDMRRLLYDLKNTQSIFTYTSNMLLGMPMYIGKISFPADEPDRVHYEQVPYTKIRECLQEAGADIALYICKPDSPMGTDKIDWNQWDRQTQEPDWTKEDGWEQKAIVSFCTGEKVMTNAGDDTGNDQLERV